MRAGRLDRLVTIQRKTSSPSDSGEPVESWSTLVARRPASRQPVSGEERIGGVQSTANEQVEFRVHYSDVLAALSPLDRVLEPAPAVGEEGSVPSRSIYDVLAVQEIGRREGLSIKTSRRADAAAT